MSKLIVFGATGGTGKQVVNQALLAGHQVTVVVRNPATFALQHPQLVTVKGDVLQPATFQQALHGQDAVISCLGSRVRAPTTVYSEGIKNFAGAMQQVGIDRLFCFSAIAVEVPPYGSLLTKLVTKYILQRVFNYLYVDMLRMEALLRESSLNWTVIRPPQLTNGAQMGHYRTTINEPIRNPTKISRSDLAHYLITHLTDEATYKARIEISY